MKCVHSLLVIACAVALPRNAYAVEQDTLVTGTAHNSVVKLTQQNFLEALEDPANPFWLLKFYAPWCAFCKKLAPVLDETAPDAAGIMAIGKVRSETSYYR
jgi:thiol-disulfide isomerase/thioredoxin